MSAAGIQFQYLPLAAVDELSLLSIGKLRPVPIHDTEAQAFKAFDCFDQSLRRSGRLLLIIDSVFELFSDTAPVISQPSKLAPTFVEKLPNGPLKQALSDVSPLRSLLPIGTGERSLSVLAFVDDDGKTHCRAQIFQFNMTDGVQVHLVQLQGIKGYGKSLKQISTHIGQIGGTPTCCGDLYTRLFPTLPVYNPKPTLRLSENETAFDAANKIVASCLSILRANEFGIVKDHDTEFLHDYRVQLRKIRSVLSLFKGVYGETQTADFKSRFSALGRRTGRLRDLDVWLLRAGEYTNLLPESLHQGLDQLFKIFSRERASEKAKLAQYLQSAEYTQEIAALVKRFNKAKALPQGVNAGLPAHEYACDRIWHHYRKVHNAAAAIGADTPDAEVHELRIRCKKLRYLIEFFTPIFPKPALKKILRPLKDLQEHLGLFNDYSVQQENLQNFLQGTGKSHDDSGLELAQTVGALIAVLHAAQLDERARIMMSLEKFNRPITRQAFSELFENRKDGS